MRRELIVAYFCDMVSNVWQERAAFLPEFKVCLPGALAWEGTFAPGWEGTLAPAKVALEAGMATGPRSESVFR